MIMLCGGGFDKEARERAGVGADCDGVEHRQKATARVVIYSRVLACGTRVVIYAVILSTAHVPRAASRPAVLLPQAIAALRCTIWALVRFWRMRFFKTDSFCAAGKPLNLTRYCGTESSLTARTVAAYQYPLQSWVATMAPTLGAAGARIAHNGVLKGFGIVEGRLCVPRKR